MKFSNYNRFLIFIKQWIRVLKLILFLVVVVFAGWILPHLFITSQENSYLGSERLFAKFALKQAEQFVGGSLEPVVITSTRIKSLKKIGDRREAKCGYDPFAVEAEYVAELRIYTLFGIPYGELKVDCAGAERIKRYWFNN